jgi:hypothetical protein
MQIFGARLECFSQKGWKRINSNLPEDQQNDFKRILVPRNDVLSTTSLYSFSRNSLYELEEQLINGLQKPALDD